VASARVREAIVGIVANPASGTDIRRLTTGAGTSTVADKVAAVRRVMVGAVQAGASRLLVLPDAYRLCRRAAEGLRLDAALDELPAALTHDEADSVRAATALRELGAGAVVVLGGDGTNRAVARGWPDVPVVAVSTGTNNVFPSHLEPTIAGAAAGLVAVGAVGLADVARRAKTVRVDRDGEDVDLALIDAVLTTDRFVGARALTEPDALRLAVLARAEPAAVGISSVGGLVLPCGPENDGGVALRFAPPAGAALVVHAPLAPGWYRPVGLSECRRLPADERVVAVGPGILALDGERQRVVASRTRVGLRVRRDGPWVVDVPAVMAAAAERGRFVRRRTGGRAVRRA
jgi:hypothetical protein